MRSDESAPSAGWTWQPQHGDAPAPKVHEPDGEQKPVLYDHHGVPLVRKKEAMGFKPPKEKR